MEDDPDPKPTDGTPPGAPAGAPMLRKKDPRKSLTIKGDFTPELRALIAKGARATGQTQFAFVTAALTAAAQRALKGEPLDPGADQAPPPAVVVDELAAAVRLLGERMAALEARDRGREAGASSVGRANAETVPDRDTFGDRKTETMAAPGKVGDGNLARDRVRGFLQRGLSLFRGR